MNWIRQSRLAQIIRKGLSGRPWYVVLFVTARCNLRCGPCFYWRELNAQPKKDELTLEELSRLADQLPHLYQLTLTGGEPTLRADLADIVAIFCRRSRVNRITIPTNGYYPERLIPLVERICTQFPEVAFSINLSVDGMAAVHDKIRGVEGSFSRVSTSHARLRQLQERHPNLFVATATVVNNHNVETIPLFLDHVRSHFDQTNHGLMLARGAIQDPAYGPPPAGVFLDLLRDLHRRCRNEPCLSHAVRTAYLRSMSRTLNRQRMADPCQAGRKLLIVNERGDVYPCEILPVLAAQGRIPAQLGDGLLGRLRETDFSLEPILSTPHAHAVRRFIVDNGCWCTFECALVNNMVLNPATYPHLAWDALRHWLGRSLNETAGPDEP